MVRVCIFLLLPGGLPPQKKAPTSIYKFIHNGQFPIVFLHIWLVPDVFFGVPNLCFIDLYFMISHPACRQKSWNNAGES